MWMTSVLLDASLRSIRHREDIRVAAVCDAGFRKPEPWIVRRSGPLLLGAVKKLFNPGEPVHVERRMLGNLYDVARKHGVEVLLPPGGDINHHDFISRLERRFKPVMALSLGCRRIFGRELLRVFERAVNFHDGLLPLYRGLLATSWSLYNREPRSGFTFHLMDEEIDSGPILFQGDIGIAPDAPEHEISWEKISKAAVCIDPVIDRMVRSDPGTPQSGAASCYGKRECLKIITVNDPSSLCWAELQQRLKAFGVLSMKILNRRYDVTELRKVKGKVGRFAALRFVTSDNVPVEVSRIMYLPRPCYEIYRLSRRLFRPSQEGRRCEERAVEGPAGAAITIQE